MGKLPGDYIAGFVDGEGCFALKFRRDIRKERKNSPIYYYWDIEFAIVLREDDSEILQRIKQTLSCGNLQIRNKAGQARYSVSKLDDLSGKVVPFFERYRLNAKKRFDFELWKDALGLLIKNRGLATNIKTTGNNRGKRDVTWDPKDLKKLEEIYFKMRPYKSRVKEWKWLQFNHPLQNK